MTVLPHKNSLLLCCNNVHIFIVATITVYPTFVYKSTPKISQERLKMMARLLQRLHLIFTLNDYAHSYSEPSFGKRVSSVTLSIWTWRTERSIRNPWIFSMVTGRQVYWLYFLGVLVKRVWSGQYEVSWGIFIILRVYRIGWEDLHMGTSYFFADVLILGTCWMIIASWWITKIESYKNTWKMHLRFLG